jgi:hypothetical protein
VTRLLTWWRARQLRALRDNAFAAAAVYMAAKTRYENAMTVAAMPRDEEDK